MYISRRELESLLGVKLTDEEWRINERMFAELTDKEWEDNHPLDE